MAILKLGSRSIALFIFFVLAYVLLFAFTFVDDALTNIPVLNFFFPGNNWDSPMYFLLPIVGFFGMYYFIQWGKTFFESKFFESKLFPIVLVFSSVIAMYIAQFFLYLPASMITGRKIFICMADCQNLSQSFVNSGKMQELIFLEFNPEFRTSAFLFFLLAALLAWVSVKILNQLEVSGKL